MSGDTGLAEFALVAAIGLALVVFPGQAWLEQGERVADYEPAPATVVSSRVAEDVGLQSGTTYYPEITYEYTVDGETYRSTNLYPGPGRTSKSRGWARRVVENHPEGATVTAHYDPTDPSSAFLRRDRELMLLVGAVVGGLTTLLALFGMGRRLVGSVH